MCLRRSANGAETTARVWVRTCVCVRARTHPDSWLQVEQLPEHNFVANSTRLPLQSAGTGGQEEGGMRHRPTGAGACAAPSACGSPCPWLE
ncbi:hypothetical protein TSMEX_004742 [Taenia solium]|eukprot:TsM_000844000 transcript=TsM_000844000 gene=TsM_000844000